MPVENFNFFSKFGSSIKQVTRSADSESSKVESKKARGIQAPQLVLLFLWHRTMITSTSVGVTWKRTLIRCSLKKRSRSGEMGSTSLRRSNSKCLMSERSQPTSERVGFLFTRYSCSWGLNSLC